MIFSSPGSILFSIGPITVRYYGAMFAIAFIVGTFFATKLARKRNISEHDLLNCALLTFIGGIIGARLYYVALQWGAHFHNHLGEIAATWNGGLSIHGGIIGASLFGAYYCIRAKLPFLQMWDVFGACVPIAQAIGRWGNFFNSELFGRPVPDDFPLKLFIPFESRPEGYKTSNYFHPTFLYESIWNLLTFVVLYYFVADRLQKYPGMTFFIYLLTYSVGRLLIEPLRTDSLMAGSIQIPMIASAASVAIAFGGLILLGIKYKRSKAPVSE